VTTKNSEEALNLYAQVEDLLGVEEVAPKLYNYYYKILQNVEFKSLLDIGCGKGNFLHSLENKYRDVYFEGIDRSSKMINICKNRQLNCSTTKLSSLNKKFDVAVATFDMVNYLNPQEFIEFFDNLVNILKSGGYFIFDLNTEYGLSELAVGNFIVDDDNRFLTIESFYENGVYESFFTLFKKQESCFKKSTEKIRQYLYSEEFLSLLGGWKIKKTIPIKLYDMEEFDKKIYLFKKI